MYLEAILLGLIIGFIRNGSFQNFMNAKFKGWIMAPIAFIVFLAPYIMALLGIEIANPSILPFIGMVVCALILIVNHDKRGVKLILIGTALNLIVMGLNGFKMPVATEGILSTSLSPFANSVSQGDIINYSVMPSGDLISKVLGKSIFLPEGYPLNRILSVGDIIISLGIVLLIQEEMRFHVKKLKNTMVRFSYRDRG